MAILRLYLPIVFWNVNELKSPIKRHIGNEWRTNQGPSICYLQETHFISKNLQKVKVKGYFIKINSKRKQE
jgi:exonuclease III